MLKISAAMPINFGPKKSVVGHRYNPLSFDDYVVSENDIRIHGINSSSRSIGKKMIELYREWKSEGLVCIIEVQDINTDEKRPRVVNTFYVARFTKINTSIIFKLSLDI